MFHKEGYTIIITSFFTITSIFVGIDFLNLNVVMTKVLRTVLIIILLLILQFFRNPRRHTLKNDTKIISPADGKIVIIKRLRRESILKKNAFKLAFSCRQSTFTLQDILLAVKLFTVNTTRVNTYSPGILNQVKKMREPQS